MKDMLLQARALERLYQKTLRLLQEDEDRLNVDPSIDSERRAKEFVASMSASTQALLVFYIQEWYGLEDLEEFLWLMPPVRPHPSSSEAVLRNA